MAAFPAGVRVWIAGGVTDMRCGMNRLALQLQQGVGRDPHGGEIFCFRGRKGDLIKLFWHDGDRTPRDAALRISRRILNRIVQTRVLPRPKPRPWRSGAAAPPASRSPNICPVSAW
ncbi:IS66 family insertion sequence element accessory protein TnpB [Paracoccus sp. IB05]|nr:IS66 family insertion sequence element accessory protein TnpB [Paracoccus sp. IB05]